MIPIFSRPVKLAQKSRAASVPHAKDYYYLRDEISDRLLDRLFDIKRPFPRILEVGSGIGAHLTRQLVKYQKNIGDKPMVRHWVSTDASVDCVNRSKKELIQELSSRKDLSGLQYLVNATQEQNPWTNPQLLHASSNQVFVDFVAVDDEHLWHGMQSITKELQDPVQFDAVVSCMNLHWVNDLAGTFIQMSRLLKPDGVFLAAMIGMDTLVELRVSLQLAEEEVWNGVSPHISPMVQVRDAASLLARAGLTMSTIDVDTIDIKYRSMNDLMIHLQRMGESNCVMQRKPYFGKRAFARAEEIYRERFGVDEEGHISATFQIIHMAGWKPDESQPRAAERGSATVSMKDLPILNVSERVGGTETEDR